MNHNKLKQTKIRNLTTGMIASAALLGAGVSEAVASPVKAPEEANVKVERLFQKKASNVAARFLELYRKNEKARDVALASTSLQDHNEAGTLVTLSIQRPAESLLGGTAQYESTATMSRKNGRLQPGTVTQFTLSTRHYPNHNPEEKGYPAADEHNSIPFNIVMNKDQTNGNWYLQANYTNLKGDEHHVFFGANEDFSNKMFTDITNQAQTVANHQLTGRPIGTIFAPQSVIAAADKSAAPYRPGPVTTHPVDGYQEMK
jgi:hypothetical protein